MDAERELRASEQYAIDERLTDRLVSVYVAMGHVCIVKNDETGFVFFEQAIELCRMIALGAPTEARLFEEYGRFRHNFGQRDEAQAHFERAARLFEASSDEESVQRLRHQLATMSA